MFGDSTNPPKDKVDSYNLPSGLVVKANASDGSTCGREKTDTSPANSAAEGANDKENPGTEKKRRTSSVNKAAALFASAKNSLHLSSLRDSLKESHAEKSSFQGLGSMDPALVVPQGPLNNSAGESLPTPHSSFRVGVTEDKNKKCRRTMEDTHAYLYNFLGTPLATHQKESSSGPDACGNSESSDTTQMVETDNGYFAIFDGHAGTFAAEWCGKKLHLILEDILRKNPSAPVPELLDQAFTSVDQQLESLPLKNSGCTAITALLRWEDRPSITPNADSTMTSTGGTGADLEQPASETPSQTQPRQSIQSTTASAATAGQRETTRSRILYTANVGDARIILCRKGKALRLSYDHKGSDENEGKRITNSGGLILNNRVNGVLAVTRALGDSYMKDLVTGHPYTTETVILPDDDEFIILACDGLWDVCSDQEAVDLIYNIRDPQAASKCLVDHALSRFSTDNLSIMVVRLDTKATQDALKEAPPPTDSTGADQISSTVHGISEADKIVQTAKRNANESKGIATEDEASPQGAFTARALDDDEDLGPEVSLPDAKSAGESKDTSSPTGRDKITNPG